MSIIDEYNTAATLVPVHPWINISDINVLSEVKNNDWFGSFAFTIVLTELSPTIATKGFVVIGSSLYVPGPTLTNQGFVDVAAVILSTALLIDVKSELPPDNETVTTLGM